MLSKSSFKGLLLPLIIIILLVFIMAGRYLMFGVPHEFLSGEYKGTFEGDYDFTLELVKNWKRGWILPSWSQTYSGPISVFASNFHVIGQAFLYFFTHNLALSIKIYQVIYFILAGISMFLLADYIYKYWLVALFCSILYMFTPFFIGEMLAYLHYTTTYFCMPLAYLFILKALDSEKYIHYALCSALIMAFNLLSHPQNMFIAGIFYFLFTLVIFLRRLFQMLFQIKNQSYRVNFIKILKIFSLVGILVFLLSVFYLLPTFLDGYPYTRSLGEAGTWLKQANRTPDFHSRWHSQNLLSSITLLSWPWFITPLKALVYPPLFFMVIYAIPFALTVLGLFWGFKGQRTPIIKVFIFLGIVSIWLSMGTRLWFFSLFSWAYKFIPFFHMSRAPYRFFYQGALSICLLSGLIIARFPKKLAPVLCSLIVIPYLYAANYYGNIYNWTFIPSEEPKYFSQVQDWLKDSNKLQHRIIETCGIPSYLGINQRMFPNGLDLLNRNITKDYLDKFLALFGYKYILAPRLHSHRHLTFDKMGYSPPRADDGYEDTEDYEEYYSALTTEYFFVYEILRNNPNFEFFTAGTKDVAIFQNKTAFDNYRIYPAKGLMILGGINAYDFLDLDRFGKYFKEDKITRIAPIFIAQSKNLKELSKIKEACEELVLHNTDFIDLFILLNQKYLIPLSNFKSPGWNFVSESFGIQQPLPYQDHSLGNFIFGDLSFSDFSLTADKKDCALDVPIEINKTDKYRILLRAYGEEQHGNLSAYLNDQYLKDIDTKGFRGFRWLQLWEGNLEAGNYVLKLTVKDYKSVYLDSVLVIPDSELEMGVIDTNQKFENLRFAYIINQQNIYRKAGSINAELFIGKDGPYDITVRLFSISDEPIKEALNLNIDSSYSIPLNYSPAKYTIQNINLNNVYLSKGRHRIAIENIPDFVGVKFISISESKNIENTFVDEEAKIEYKQSGADSYRGTLKLNRPLVLVHTETNYSGWKLKIGHKFTRPIITNMFLNGFIVDNIGNIKFNIFYLNSWKTIGTVISLITLILIIMFLIKFKRIK